MSDNETGLTTLYDGTGAVQPLVVTIPPAAGSSATGTPTGQVFNPSSTDFVVKSGKKKGPASFLFATEDGTISGWNFSVNSAAAIRVVDLSASKAVFEGLAYFTDSKGHNFLLAADLHGGVVDMFNNKYKLVASFRDTGLDPVYAPFNVAVLNGNIYVAYAWVNGARNDIIPHPGWGVVEQVSETGTVLAKAAGGKLNAPWGMAIAPRALARSAEICWSAISATGASRLYDRAEGKEPAESSEQETARNRWAVGADCRQWRLGRQRQRRLFHRGAKRRSQRAFRLSFVRKRPLT